jgi:hypothetical protein
MKEHFGMRKSTSTSSTWFSLRFTQFISRSAADIRRSSSKTGPRTGPSLSRRSSSQVAPTHSCVRTTWLFSNYSGSLALVANFNSEEIFDFSSEKMTTHKTTRLKNQFCQEFSEIFQLCTEVLEKAQLESLISATLETTLRFLSWVPLGYIFGTNIVALLHERVWPDRHRR